MKRIISFSMGLFFVTLVSPAMAADQPAKPATDSNSTAANEVPVAPTGYKLVWSDEFNTEGPPDPKNWTYERGFVRNQEAQWYQPENARCENGMLIIEGRREQKKNPNYEAGSPRWQRNREFADYTSASLTTRGLHDWTYGRFEMRGRIDIRDGLWPAWWTLGRGRWPAAGEIDIMEYYRGMLKANIAWAGENRRGGATWNSQIKQVDKFVADWSKQFHTWRMDWDDKHIKLFVDDVQLNDQDLSKTIDSDGTNPFIGAPQFMILNLAIGGTEGGDPSKTEFPAKFEVDYVRVYQKTDSATDAGASTNVHASTDATKARPSVVTVEKPVSNSNSATLKVSPVPEGLRQSLKLDSFYKKYVDAQGFPILSSEKVSDAALLEAAEIVNHMLADREDVRQAIIKNRIRLAIMSPRELTTDIPEHSDLIPKDYWDHRARGLGATYERPAVSGVEENLLNLPGDHYARENILVHEFAHTIHEMGLNTIDPAFDAKLRGIYEQAMKKELWKNTYAATNYKEYWAEGVQSYFDCNDRNNASHGDIDTREKLEKYDPDLFQLIDETFHHSPWRYVRYDKRQAPSPAHN